MNTAGLEYVLLATHCGQVVEIPPCLRIAVSTSEVLGIARPNWQFHPDPEP